MRFASASQRCGSAAEADDVRVIEVIAPRSGGCSRWSNILGWDVCLRDWGLRFLWIEAGDIFLRGPGLEGGSGSVSVEVRVPW